MSIKFLRVASRLILYFARNKGMGHTMPLEYALRGESLPLYDHIRLVVAAKGHFPREMHHKLISPDDIYHGQLNGKQNALLLDHYFVAKVLQSGQETILALWKMILDRHDGVFDSEPSSPTYFPRMDLLYVTHQGRHVPNIISIDKNKGYIQLLETDERGTIKYWAREKPDGTWEKTPLPKIRIFNGLKPDDIEISLNS